MLGNQESDAIILAKRNAAIYLILGYDEKKWLATESRGKPGTGRRGARRENGKSILN